MPILYMSYVMIRTRCDVAYIEPTRHNKPNIISQVTQYFVPVITSVYFHAYIVQFEIKSLLYLQDLNTEFQNYFVIYSSWLPKIILSHYTIWLQSGFGKTFVRCGAQAPGRFGNSHWCRRGYSRNVPEPFEASCRMRDKIWLSLFLQFAAISFFIFFGKSMVMWLLVHAGIKVKP